MPEISLSVVTSPCFTFPPCNLSFIVRKESLLNCVHLAAPYRSSQIGNIFYTSSDPSVSLHFLCELHPIRVPLIVGRSHHIICESDDPRSTFARMSLPFMTERVADLFSAPTRKFFPATVVPMP